jgi:hypothetical protein
MTEQLWGTKYINLGMGLKKYCRKKYCDVHAVGNIAGVDNRCYGNG